MDEVLKAFRKNGYDAVFFDQGAEAADYLDKKIDDDIAFLVQNGLSKQIQSALDIVRVVGNNSVHPGELSNDDIQDSAITLFELVNLIVENQITQPKKIDEMYTNLVPESIREKRTEAVSK